MPKSISKDQAQEAVEQALTIAKQYGDDAERQWTKDTIDEVGIYTGSETTSFLLSESFNGAG